MRKIVSCITYIYTTKLSFFFEKSKYMASKLPKARQSLPMRTQENAEANVRYR